MCAKKKTDFVSDIDKTLDELRSVVPESLSQRAERVKAENIARLRDEVQPVEDRLLWKDF